MNTELKQHNLPAMRINLLGQPECWADTGDLVGFSTRKSEVLFAYLALSPGIRHPREKLYGLLWSDRGEEQARNSLRQTLSQLKKTFDVFSPNLLDIDRHVVMLPQDRIQVDVGEFERLITDPTYEKLTKAVSLYRSELLDGIFIRDSACQEWLEYERDRLRRLIVATLSKLNQIQIAQKQYAAAIESAERMVTYDALQEFGWRQLMISYYLNGDRSHGILAYQRCCNILQIELGVDPDKETSALYEQLKQQQELNLDDINDGRPNLYKLASDGQESHRRRATDHLPEEQSELESLTDSSSNIRVRDHFMQGWYHATKHNPKDAAKAIEQFKKCIEVDPNNAKAYAILGLEYNVERYENWSVDRDQSLEQSRYYLEKSLELDPENMLAHVFMAEYLLFKREFKQSLLHAEKAVTLKSDPDSCSMKALVLASTGEYEKARKFADRSLKLDPHHPYSGWAAGSVYRYIGEYELAIRTLKRIPQPPPSVFGEIAACLVGTGDIQEARQVMAQYHELGRHQMPHYPVTRKAWRQLWYENIAYESIDDFDRFFDMLIKAGLCDETSDLHRSLPSIAVLPFENLSDDPNQAHFSDGIVSDIVSILSRVKGMRVVARYSTLQYKNNPTPLAKIAEQQNVRYLLGGSLRTSNNQIRVNVELVDSNTGNVSWAEQYDRDMNDLFVVQDDITQNMIGAIRGHFYGGERDLLRTSGTRNLKAWELCLQATDLQDSYIRENIVEARRLVKKALLLDSNYCYAWVTLGWTFWQEVFCNWCSSTTEALDEAERASQMALETNLKFAEAWSLKGLIHVMNHQADRAVVACQKAVDLEPGNAEVQALYACALCYAGEYRRAEVAYQHSVRHCPTCPNWYIMIGGVVDLFFGRTEQAIIKFRQGIDVEPDSPLCRYYLADALIEAGEIEEAGLVVEEIRNHDESLNVSGIVRMHSHNQDERERFLGNLEKAGLTI